MDPRSPTKRKRALSTTSTSYSTISSSIINPLSHPPSTLKQFIPSGNSSDAPLPSSIYPDFPHKPLPSSPTSSRPHSRSRSRSRRGSFASSTHHSHSDLDDATSTAGTDIDIDFDGQTDAETLSVTSTGKPYTKRDPVRSAAKTHKLHQKRVGALVAVIQRSLADGDISLARRAFGLLVRADINGKKVDLRYGGYWEMGAEILMRAGEDRPHFGSSQAGGSQYGLGSQLGLGEDGEGGMEGEEGGEDSKNKRERRRLLRAGRNKEQVKAYYEALIHLHPWSRMNPNKMGALDFYPALFGFEMEVCFAEHRYSVDELDRQPLEPVEDEELPLDGDRFGRDEMDIDPFSHGQQSFDQLRSSPPDYTRGDNVHPLYRSEVDRDQLPHIRLRNEKEKLRLRALEQMRDVARRMDAVMENSPYNKDPEMLRLRAMVALYVGDLCVPVSAEELNREEDGMNEVERLNEEEGRRAQKAERERARGLLEKMRELRGGELDEEDRLVLEMISGEGEEDEHEEEEEEGRGRG